MQTSFLPILLAGVFTTLHVSGDWVQFRGPHACGLDESEPLATEWDVPSGNNVLWSTPLSGLGHSSPIIVGNRIYITTAIGPKDRELKVGLYGDIDPVEESSEYEWRLLALDRDSGKILWSEPGYKGVPKVKRHPKSTHCNCTPASDGKHLVAIFGSEGLFCFDMNGKLLWKKDLGPMDSGFFMVPSAQWGFASSPVISDGKVIVLCDVQTNSFLASFDVATGKELWRTPRNDVPTWGTPAIIESKGRKQIAVNGWHHTGGYAFSTGKELWKLDGGGDIPVPTPISANGLIYVTSGHGKLRPMRAIRADATGDITPETPRGTNAGIAWVHPRQGNYMQTPLVAGNRVYACTDWGILTCFDATNGTIIYSERLTGPTQGYTASPVSDGRNLYFPGETGKVLVVPVADQFSIVATNDLDDNCMATPAIAAGTLFFRTQTKLIAVANK